MSCWSGPYCNRKTCQVILESHSFEKIKRIKNRTQFCPNSKASNGRPCSNSVWTTFPQAKRGTAASPPANERHRLFSFSQAHLQAAALCCQSDSKCNTLQHLKNVRLHHTALRGCFSTTPRPELSRFNQSVHAEHLVTPPLHECWVMAIG